MLISIIIYGELVFTDVFCILVIRFPLITYELFRKKTSNIGSEGAYDICLKQNK